MKKSILILLALIPFVCFSQSFIATSNGLRDISNQEKEYLVLTFEGKTANQLYDLTNKFCQKNYVSPQNALKSDIKNEFLKIKTFAKSFIQLQKGMFGESYYANITYAANFSFKDGKVKFEINEVEMKNWTGDVPVYYNSPGGLSWSIFKSNGKPRGDLPEQYQSYFNKYVSDYISFINNYAKENDNW